VTEANSTPTTPRSKPCKPYPAFPLFAHAAGVWARKIRGKLSYFGPWSDPDGALAKYLEQKDALHAGRKPRDQSNGVTCKQLVNRFLDVKASLRDAGEITNRSWDDYKAACDIIIAEFSRSRLVEDIDPEDFGILRRKLAKKWGPVTLGNAIQRIRVVFKFAWDEGLIARPVRYGQSFKRPTRKVIRLERARKGPKLFRAEEIRRLLDAAPIHIQAMILLGTNAGFGPADCGTLPLNAIDLASGIVDFPRPKTGIPRRAVLWPETVVAINQAIAQRPQPANPEHDNRVFITKYGAPWFKDSSDHTLTKEFAKLLHKLRINGRKGLGFYTLRHTFRTVADEAKDQPATDYIMGHEVPHMSSVYRETISDERLKAVTEYLRRWLFAEKYTPPVE
jgi:integrase